MCNFDHLYGLDDQPTDNQVHPPTTTPVVQQQSVSHVFITL